jgi:hypothetical protein
LATKSTHRSYAAARVLAAVAAAALLACNAILGNNDRTIGPEEDPSSGDASGDKATIPTIPSDGGGGGNGGGSDSSDGNLVVTDTGTSGGDADADAPPRVFVGCLGNPACERVIFVTSFAFTGNLEGVAGADAKCQTAADQSALVRLKDHQFVAWLSTSQQDAKNRVVQGSQKYVRANGTTVIADNFNELITTGPKSAIHDEADVLKQKGAWTGTDNGGNRSVNTCGDWTMTTGVQGLTGDPDQPPTWSADPPSINCTDSAILICIER